ncbi:MAG: hypothetical protein JKY99_08525 [Rhizobiales bacterium]|nr:hypothetical protein [Hyphomicrobiales bacterium]
MTNSFDRSHKEPHFGRAASNYQDSYRPENPPKKSKVFLALKTVFIFSLLTTSVYLGYVVDIERLIGAFSSQAIALAPRPLATKPVADSTAKTAPAKKEFYNMVAVNQTSKAGVHPIIQQLISGGITACAGRAQQLIAALHMEENSIIVSAPQTNKNTNITTLIAMRRGPQEDLKIVNLAPNQTVGCGATFQQIKTSTMPCVDYISVAFKDAKLIKPPNSDSYFVNISATSNAIALDTPSGCTFIQQDFIR